MSRNEKRRMGIYVVTGIVLVAVVAVLSVAVLKKRDSKNAQAANPSYREEIRLNKIQIWEKIKNKNSLYNFYREECINKILEKIRKGY